MQASQTPTLVPLAFAANGTKNTIPENSQIGITPGAASLNDGFPPLTFTPIAAGGVPPAGADFNGVLNLITQTIRWKQAGGMFGYNSAFATDANVGGYPKGAILQNAAATGIWSSTVDNNTSNPDTGGANWVAGFTAPLAVGPATASQHAMQLGQATGRLLNVQTFSASGTYTPTAGTNKIIVEAWGGGGGGAGCPSTGAAQAAVAGGGGGGAYIKALYTSGFSSGITVTIGAGGTAGVAGANSGGSGGTTTFGALLTIAGGSGSSSTPAGTPPLLGGAGGSGVAGSAPGGTILDVSIGQAGGPAFAVAPGASLGGAGGSSAGHFGPAGASAGAPGVAGAGAGCGGSGGSQGASGGALAGGAGSAGKIIVYEYA